MYAILETGGKQYRVRPGDTIAVERLNGDPGQTLDLGHVLMVGGEGVTTRVGTPGVEGAVVRAEVVGHERGEKIIVFRFKSKVRYRRKTGHRQHLTRLRITDILVDGASAAPAQPEPTPPPQPTPSSEPEAAAPEPALEAETEATPRRRRASASEPAAESAEE